VTTAAQFELHPELDVPTFHGLIHSGRSLWTPRQLRDVTRAVSTKLTAQLLSVLRYEEPQRWWARLALTDSVEIWLLSWLPGQGTPPHDHGGAAGSFTVLRGGLIEDYVYPESPIRSHRLAAGAGVGFSGSRAHQVRNLDTEPAASVHAYSPPLRPMREYASLEDAS